MFTENEVNGMLVSQLKEELKTRGASTTGKKAELCARLIELIGTVENENSTENQQSSSNHGEESRGEPTEVPSVSSTGEERTEEQKPNPKEELTEQSQSQATSFEAEPISTKEEVKDTHNDVNDQTAVSISTPDVEKSSENETKVHVRIDYFQRPLNLKSLIDWLEKQCECSLSLESIWVNAIKTHCYVDFPSHEIAQLCIDKVTGQRYPASSAYTLEADFTTVSAKDAPTAPEAAMKPGEWKLALTLATSAADAGDSSPAAGGITVTINNTSEDGGMEAETAADEGVERHLSPSGAGGNKRRLVEVVDDAAAAGEASLSPATSPTAGSSKTRRLVGGNLDIFRRATAGILFGKPGGGVVGSSLGTVGAQPRIPSGPTPIVSDQINRNNDITTTAQTTSVSKSNETTIATQSLDELFRKTVAKPSLYWQHAPDEVIQQRLKNKLKLKVGNHSK